MTSARIVAQECGKHLINSVSHDAFILPVTFPKMEIIFNITEDGGKAAFSFAKWQRGKWRLAGLPGCFSRWTKRWRQWDGHQHVPGPATTIVLLESPEGDSGSRLEMF